MIPKWLINTCLYFFARLSYGIIIAEIGINYIASFNTFVWLYCLFVPSNCLDSQRDNSPLASKAFFLNVYKNTLIQVWFKVKEKNI